MFGSASAFMLQSAVKLRHLQRHEDGRNLLGALCSLCTTLFKAQPGSPLPPPPPPPPPPPHLRVRRIWISPRWFGVAAASRLSRRSLLLKVVKVRAALDRRGGSRGALKWQPSLARPPPAQLRSRRRPRRFRRSRAVSSSMASGQRHCCAARLGGGGVLMPRRGCGRCCGAGGRVGRCAPLPLTAATSSSASRGGSPTAAPPQRRGRRPATGAEAATAAHGHRRRPRRPRGSRPRRSWRRLLRLAQGRWVQCGTSHGGSRSHGGLRSHGGSSPHSSGKGPWGSPWGRGAPAASRRRPAGGASGLGWCARSPGSRAV